MPRIPKVAIVGRPNVGKSALFNRLAGRRVAIVEPTAGVTRDRVGAELAHAGRAFELVDTGGIGVVDRDDLSPQVEAQIAQAIEESDLLLFVVDVRDGVTPLDREVAKRLRPAGKPLILVANKADTQAFEPAAAEFYALGLGDPLPVSAVEGFGRADLLDRIASSLPPPGGAEERAASPPEMKLAIVGKRNVGKSTFVNALAREERVIVSEVPGTTRDSIDVRFERGGKAFVAIDTAGLRKRTKAEHAIEVFSAFRTEESIRRADVACLMVECTRNVTEVDKKIADLIVKHSKPCVVVGNKWDLAEREMGMGEWADYVRASLPLLTYAPLVATVASEGKRVFDVVGVALDLWRQAHVRVPTGELMRAVEAAEERVRPRTKGKWVPKLYYATQAGIAPPTFVFFVNQPRLFDRRYRRYLANCLREAFPFKEIPLKLVFKARAAKEQEAARPRAEEAGP